MKIYIVQGDNGEQYGDQREWPVIAYDSLSLAEQHAAHAEARSAAIKRIEHQRGWGVARTESNEFDPIGQCPGAQYSVYPLELIVQSFRASAGPKAPDKKSPPEGERQ